MKTPCSSDICSLLSFGGWSNINDDFAFNVFHHFSPEEVITTISLVCLQWNKATDQRLLGISLLGKIRIGLKDNTSWKVAYKQFLTTIFCIAIDFSCSMDFYYHPKTRRHIAAAKALKIAEALKHPISKGNLYCMQFGNDCKVKKINVIEEVRHFFNQQSILLDKGTDIDKVFSQIGELYADEIKSGKRGETGKMEVTIISDFDCRSTGKVKSLQLQELNIDFRFIQVAKNLQPKFVAFRNTTLEYLKDDSMQEFEEEKRQNDGDTSSRNLGIIEYGKTALVFSDIEDQEIERPLKRRKL